MAAKRCPLCGGSVKDNYCGSCGYTIPDEAEISALYNYDPSDYPQEEPAVREITPKHITEEIYPNRPEPPKFEVRENRAETKNNSPYANPYAGQDNGLNGGANPYANNNPPQNQNQNNNQNPYANGNFKPYANPNQSKPAGGFWDFIKNNIIFAIITLIFPWYGIIWLITSSKNADKSHIPFIIILMVLGVILPP